MIRPVNINVPQKSVQHEAKTNYCFNHWMVAGVQGRASSSRPWGKAPSTTGTLLDVSFQSGHEACWEAQKGWEWKRKEAVITGEMLKLYKAVNTWSTKKRFSQGSETSKTSSTEQNWPLIKLINVGTYHWNHQKTGKQLICSQMLTASKSHCKMESRSGNRETQLPGSIQGNAMQLLLTTGSVIPQTWNTGKAWPRLASSKDLLWAAAPQSKALTRATTSILKQGPRPNKVQDLGIQNRHSKSSSSDQFCHIKLCISSTQGWRIIKTLCVCACIYIHTPPHVKVQFLLGRSQKISFPHPTPSSV